MPHAKCRVCELTVPEGQFASGGRRVDCRRCGNYAISDEALEDLPSILKKRNASALLSYFIRRMSIGNKRPKLTSEILSKIVEQESLPNPAEQADNLITALGSDSSDDPGQLTTVDPQKYMARAGASSIVGLNFVVGQLMAAGMVDGTWVDWPEPDGAVHVNGQVRCRLTLKGWNRFEQLKRSGGSGFSAFLAMKFGDP